MILIETLAWFFCGGHIVKQWHRRASHDIHPKRRGEKNDASVQHTMLPQALARGETPALAVSLSSHRYSYIGLLLSSHFNVTNVSITGSYVIHLFKIFDEKLLFILSVTFYRKSWIIDFPTCFMNRLKCHLLQLVLSNWFIFSSPGSVSYVNSADNPWETPLSTWKTELF
jgi:hypothetical protein